VASLSQGRTAAAQCGLFTYKSVPVIFEPPCNISWLRLFISRYSQNFEPVLLHHHVTELLVTAISWY